MSKIENGFNSLGPIILKIGITTNAGNSIQNQAHPLFIIKPQPLELCLPYGVLILETIKYIKVKIPRIIQALRNRLKFSKINWIIKSHEFIKKSFYVIYLS